MSYPVRDMKNENLDWINHIFASNLTSKAKLLGSILGSYMHGSDEAYPGLARLTFESSLSRRSVQNAIDELSREGWIVKKPGGITATGSLSPNHYQRLWKSGIKRASYSGPSTLKNAVEPMAPEAQSVSSSAIPVVLGAIPCGTDSHTPWHQLPTNKINNKIDNIVHMVIEDDRPIKSANIDTLGAKAKSNAVNQEVAFNAFWSMWPKKVAKTAARKAWSKIKDQPVILALIASNLEMHASAGDWENQQYIPNPATYLNGERWNDTVTPRQDNRSRHAGVAETLSIDF